MNLSFLQKFYLLVFLFGFSMIHAQSPGWGWAQRAGGSGAEEGRQAVTDADGNLYIWGTFASQTIQFDSFTLNKGSLSDSCYLVKLNGSGTTLWAKAIPILKAIQTDASGNLIVAGQVEAFSTLTLGSFTLTNIQNVPQAFVAKYSSSGNVLSLRQVGEVYTIITAMAPLGDSSFAITGTSYQDIIDGEVVGSTTWIAKMDTGTGIISSIKKLMPFGNELKFIKTDRQHNVYFSGAPNADMYTENWQFNGPCKTYIAKFDEDLEFEWATLFDSTGNIQCSDLAFDNDGNVYAAGDFLSGNTVTVDPENIFHVPALEINEIGDFLAKLSPDGNVIWDNIMIRPPTNLIRTRKLCSDKLGNIYYGGNYNGQLTLGEYTVGSADAANIFVSKFNDAGDFLWLQTNTLTGRCYLTGMAEDNSGSIYLSGYNMQGSTAFGTIVLNMAAPTSSNPYAGDMFVAKTGSCDIPVPVISPNSGTICNSGIITLQAPEGAQYLWSNGEKTQSVTVNEEGEYSVTVANATGCYKTAVPVTITAVEINNSITQTQDMLTANMDGAAYQWGQCSENGAFQPVEGAISQSFTPQQSGSYAVTVMMGTCSEISDCVTFEVLGNGKFEKSGVKIYPNPNNGNYTIALPNDITEAQLTVYDISGRKVESLLITGNITAISHEDLEAGIYNAVIESATKRNVVKIIIQ